jgi:hypothetical protein
MKALQSCRHYITFPPYKLKLITADFQSMQPNCQNQLFLLILELIAIRNACACRKTLPDCCRVFLTGNAEERTGEVVTQRLSLRA